MNNVVDVYSLVVGNKEDGLFKKGNVVIQGGTNGGKSVFIKKLAIALMREHTAEQLKLALVDLKGLEFFDFQYLPYLYCNTVDEEEEVEGLLQKLAKETEARDGLFATNGVENYQQYLALCEEKGLEKPPRIVCIIDELDELCSRQEVKSLLMRLLAGGNRYGVNAIVSAQSCEKDLWERSANDTALQRIIFYTYYGDEQFYGDLFGAKIDEIPQASGEFLYQDSSTTKPVLYAVEKTSQKDIIAAIHAIRVQK